MAKIWLSIGMLVLVILSVSVYIMLPDKIRIDVQETKTLYSLYDSNSDSYNLAATERVILRDGSAIMRAKERKVEWKNESGIITINRTAKYKDNISTYDEYVFDSGTTDIELMPVSHTTICYNCIGKILEFEYKDIYYDGDTKEITSPFTFGKKNNMKLEWQEGSYLSKVYTYKIASPKIWIRYRPIEAVQTYEVRLFDPKGISDCAALNTANTVYELTTSFVNNTESSD